MTKIIRVEPLEPRQLLTIAFAAPVHFPVPSLEGGVLNAPTIGDFDGDAKADIIVGNATDTASGTTNIVFAKGDGAGIFTPTGTPLTPGVFTGQPKAGDFNNDDKLDLVVADEFDDLIRVLLGNGDGTFQSPVNVPTGTSPGDVVVADLNADGFDDAVVNNRGAPDDRGNDVVSILLGGAGGLGAPANLNVGDDPASVAIAKVNSDNFFDLVIGNSGGQSAGATGNVQTFLGIGNGTFNPTPVVTAGPRGISDVADFNNDSKVDIALSVSASGVVTLLLGNGDGSFQNATPPNELQFLVTAADFDGDGKIDLAATSLATDALSILPGNGDGTFAARQDIAIAGAGPIAIGELSGDAKPDIGVASFASGPRITTALNTSTPGGPTPGTGPDLTATITGKLPTSAVVGGLTKGRFAVKVTNASTDTELTKQNVTVRLVASSDGTPEDTDPLILAVTKSIRLKAGKSAAFKFNIKYPVVPTDGPYNIIAQVDPANAVVEANDGNNTATTGPVTIAAPFIDLRGTFAKAVPTTLTANKAAAFLLNVENLGNIPAKGTVPVVLVASLDNAVSGDDLALGTALPKVNILPGKTKKVPLKLKLPATLAPGSYFVIAQINSGGTIAESDATNNVAVSAEQTTIA